MAVGAAACQKVSPAKQPAGKQQVFLLWRHTMAVVIASGNA